MSSEKISHTELMQAFADQGMTPRELGEGSYCLKHQNLFVSWEVDEKGFANELHSTPYDLQAMKCLPEIDRRQIEYHDDVFLLLLRLVSGPFECPKKKFLATLDPAQRVIFEGYLAENVELADIA